MGLAGPRGVSGSRALLVPGAGLPVVGVYPEFSGDSGLTFSGFSSVTGFSSFAGFSSAFAWPGAVSGRTGASLT